MARLDGKVAVITGGSSGIGLATGQRFVDKGAYVFIMGRRHSELDKAKAQEDGVFGPLLPVLTYSSLDEAFQRMSETPRPLAGFVFSRNQSTINRFINQLSYGGGAVNQVDIQLLWGRCPSVAAAPPVSGTTTGNTDSTCSLTRNQCWCHRPMSRLSTSFPVHRRQGGGARTMVSVLSRPCGEMVGTSRRIPRPMVRSQDESSTDGRNATSRARDSHDR